MNNRELINNQLNNSSNSNSLFVVRSGGDIQHQIPDQLENDTQQSSLGSVNNFNVNVNVNGSPTTTNPRQQVKNILNNVLNVQQPKTSEDLKKNYKQPLSRNGNFNYNNTVQQIIPQNNYKINYSDNFLLKTYNQQNENNGLINNYLNTENVLNRNLINVDSDSTSTNMIPNDISQNISYDTPDKITKQNINKKQFLNKIENKNNSNNFSNIVNSLTIYSDLKNPVVNSYSYSMANIKSENSNLNLAFQNLNEIIRGSTPQSSIVSSTFKNEFTVDQIQNQRNLYENKNFTLQTVNQNNNLEFMDNTIRKQESIMVNRNNIIQNQILQMAKNNEKHQEDMELVDEMNDIVPVNKDSLDMMVGNHNMPNKEFIHINEEYDNDRENMLIKMNSPPIWRTALG